MSYLVGSECTSYLGWIIGIEQTGSCATRDYFVPSRVAHSALLRRVDHMELGRIIQLELDLGVFLSFGRRSDSLQIAPPRGLLRRRMFLHKIDLHEGVVRAIDVHIQVEVDEMVVDDTDHILGQKRPVHALMVGHLVHVLVWGAFYHQYSTQPHLQIRHKINCYLL